MRRGIVLGVLLALGALVAIKAQPPAANAPKVVEVEKVKDNLYVLRGGGGNTAVFLTANGVIVVDAKNPGWGKPILDKIKELTPKPVTTLINTHTHGDHVSGNVEFPATIDVVRAGCRLRAAGASASLAGARATLRAGAGGC